MQRLWPTETLRKLMQQKVNLSAAKATTFSLVGPFISHFIDKLARILQIFWSIFYDFQVILQITLRGEPKSS